MRWRAEYRRLPAPALRAASLQLSGGKPLGKVVYVLGAELEAAMAECDEALNVLGVLPEGGNAIAAREAEDAAQAEAAEAAAMSPSGRRRKGSAPAPLLQVGRVGIEVDLRFARGRTPARISPSGSSRCRRRGDGAHQRVSSRTGRISRSAAARDGERPRTLCDERRLQRHRRRGAGAAPRRHEEGRRGFAAAQTAEARGPAGATRDLAPCAAALTELHRNRPQAMSRA